MPFIEQNEFLGDVISYWGGEDGAGGENEKNRHIHYNLPLDSYVFCQCGQHLVLIWDIF